MSPDPNKTDSPKEESRENKEDVDKVEKWVNWPKFLFVIYLNICGLWGFSMIFSQAKILTTLFTLALIMCGMLGLTAGCHRLWAHCTYKAESSLRVFLMLCATLTGQCSIHDWVVDHRVHHKHHGTPDDPYNYKRGFFYCHIKSHLLCHDEATCKRLNQEIDDSDLENDSVVAFQRTYYWVLTPLVAILLPMTIPVKLWGEDVLVALMLAVSFRLAVLLQAGWLINSASIVWGLDPLDRKSTDTSLVFIVTKSLWPQYHYLLPWDYLSGEYGTYDSGCSTAFIKIMAVLGLATGLTTITSQGVKDALGDAVHKNVPVLDSLAAHKTITKIPEILAA